MINIEHLVKSLTDKNTVYACKCFNELETICQNSNEAYKYFDFFTDMLDSDNSYIRTRGLILISLNAKWDCDYKIDEVIDKYLRHITDIKPITARQCIKMLPTIAKYKPELKNDIVMALRKANPSIYKDSMTPLVAKDIQNALKIIG